MRAKARFSYLLAASALVAILVVILPRYLPLGRDANAILTLNLVFGALWCVLTIAAIRWYRWRGLWLLVGIPFLLYWPTMFWLLSRACNQNINACP